MTSGMLPEHSFPIETHLWAQSHFTSMSPPPKCSDKRTLVIFFHARYLFHTPYLLPHSCSSSFVTSSYRSSVGTHAYRSCNPCSTTKNSIMRNTSHYFPSPVQGLGTARHKVPARHRRISRGNALSLISEYTAYVSIHNSGTNTDTTGKNDIRCGTLTS